MRVFPQTPSPSLLSGQAVLAHLWELVTFVFAGPIPNNHYDDLPAHRNPDLSISIGGETCGSRAKQHVCHPYGAARVHYPDTLTDAGASPCGTMGGCLVRSAWRCVRVCVRACTLHACDVCGCVPTCPESTCWLPGSLAPTKAVLIGTTDESAPVCTHAIGAWTVLGMVPHVDSSTARYSRAELLCRAVP